MVFQATAAEHIHDNDSRAEAIEALLISEAIKAGVVAVKPHRQHKNPNKWAKHMAPWFNENCRTARAGYRAAARAHGNHHVSTKTALQNFLQCCRKSRAKL